MRETTKFSYIVNHLPIIISLLYFHIPNTVEWLTSGPSRMDSTGWNKKWVISSWFGNLGFLEAHNGEHRDHASEEQRESGWEGVEGRHDNGGCFYGGRESGGEGELGGGYWGGGKIVGGEQLERDEG